MWVFTFSRCVREEQRQKNQHQAENHSRESERAAELLHIHVGRWWWWWWGTWLWRAATSSDSPQWFTRHPSTPSADADTKTHSGSNPIWVIQDGKYFYHCRRGFPRLPCVPNQVLSFFFVGTEHSTVTMKRLKSPPGDQNVSETFLVCVCVFFLTNMSVLFWPAKWRTERTSFSRSPLVRPQSPKFGW